MQLIDVKNAAFSYGGNIVISGLSFKINKGDYLCIVGENGSGKSTLVKGLLGLKKPAAGKIIKCEGFSNNSLGYLPQGGLFKPDFPASVFEVVLSGRLNRLGFHPFFTKADKSEAISLLKKLGVLQLKKRKIGQLSGGQQQRVLLARALLAGGQILLLDEPASGLDPNATNELYSLAAQLNNEGVTIVMVTHDPKALSFASHVLHVGRSQNLFLSTADYLKSDTGRLFCKGAKNDR